MELGLIGPPTGVGQIELPSAIGRVPLMEALGAPSAPLQHRLNEAPHRLSDNLLSLLGGVNAVSLI